jgi:hypothetical protein
VARSKGATQGDTQHDLVIHEAEPHRQNGRERSDADGAPASAAGQNVQTLVAIKDQ